MKFQWIIGIGLGLLAGAVVAQDQAADSNTAEPIVADIELTTLMDKASYGIGLNIGRQFHQQGVAINIELVTRGLADAMAERTPLLSDEELSRTARLVGNARLTTHQIIEGVVIPHVGAHLTSIRATLERMD